ncbi:MAG: methyl-accepting chemotaxis protein [Oscillospiraceae bacterium]|jgi:methyl-accepting chemotaxis protein|nr:methyl-accepting chemotaxis protein [Oscillospiraceae bacterium]
MKKASLKMAVLVPLMSLLTVGVVGMVVIISMVSSSSTNDLTNEIIDAKVAEYVNEFKAIGTDGYAMVSTLAPVVHDLRQSSDEPRGDIVSTLVDVLGSSANTLAIWSGWEPDALDGRDDEYRNADEVHDGSGRFVPYVFKEGSAIHIEPLIGYDDPVAGIGYLAPIQSGKPYITDPYPYEVGGKTIVMYSISVPILENGKAIGVVGMDISLEGLTNVMNAGQILADGYLFTLSPDGLFATHSNADLVLQSYKTTWMKDSSAQVDALLAGGGSFNVTAFSDVTNTNMKFLANGVMIGDTGRYWAVCGVVPESTVNAASNRLVWLVVIIGLVIIVVAGFAILLLLNNGLKRMPVITEMAERIARGDIGSIRADSDAAPTKNEIALLERAFSDISNSIQEQANVMVKIADGDYSLTIPVRSEADVMNKAINNMVDRTNETMNEIRTSTAQVSSGSKQIADGSQALAQGSTQQAASVEQLSASISDIADKTKVNAEMAGKAAILGNTIMQNAEKGSRQMEEMMDAVKEINAASQQISKVIKVIDDIAFQTNILALNAAVEAARAGQHGKGFAVVAEEVRSLASKSADAAKETGNLIANSTEKAELGSRIAEETSASLTEIVQGINESSQLVSQIAQSSDEQSAGIAQINKGIDQVAQVVQQNSATAEESAAASEEMSGQSAMLEELIAQFKLKDSGQQKISRPAQRATLPAAAGRRQIAMPEKAAYTADGDGFGKY